MRNCPAEQYSFITARLECIYLGDKCRNYTNYKNCAEYKRYVPLPITIPQQPQFTKEQWELR